MQPETVSTAKTPVASDKEMKKNIFKKFPIFYYSIGLGLSGLVVSTQRIEQLFNLNFQISDYLLYLAMSIYTIISFFYLMKLIFHFSEVKKEWHHPIKLSFFGTISIPILLLNIAFFPNNLFISKILWIIGSILQLVFSVSIFNIWIYRENFEIDHINPGWLIPVVGLILVPVTGVEHFFIEISWLYYSAGLIMWISLFAIIYYRVIFHNPMEGKLFPTFLMFLAPPAVGFISYIKLNGHIDNFGKILYSFALFMAVVMLFQLKVFSKLKFYLSWWTYSFPLSSMTISSLLMYKLTGTPAFKIIGIIFYLILVSVILMLIPKTLHAIFSQKVESLGYEVDKI